MCDPKWPQKWSRNGQETNPKMDPRSYRKIEPNSEVTLVVYSGGGFLEALVFKVASKWPKISLRWPEMAQDVPNIHQDGPKMAPRRPEMAHAKRKNRNADYGRLLVVVVIDL